MNTSICNNQVIVEKTKQHLYAVKNYSKFNKIGTEPTLEITRRSNLVKKYQNK